MTFRMGHKKDKLNVYGSADGVNWALIKDIETTTTSYKNYTLNFPSNSTYTCFKLDVNGDQQIRIESMTITYIANNEEDDSNNNDNEDLEEIITIPAPIFNPGPSTFNAESLIVNISTAEGYDIYYTTDGSTPSYTDANSYNGTKGNVVTIYASNFPITLQAIAVDPATKACSDICRATYEYIAPTEPDDDSKPSEPEPTEPNNGSKSKPYIVTDIWDMPTSTTKEEVWIRGTIYGTIGNNGLTAAGTVSTNIVIGNATTYVPIELPKGEIRDAINLRDHPYLKGKELLIKGNIEKYYNKLGLKSPSTYTVSYNVAVNSYGYASLYLDMPVEVPSGCTAYYCTTEGDQAYLHPVGNIIPDSTGVIISCEPNSSCALTYTTGANEDEEHIHAENQLVGFAKETVVEEDGYAYYALNAKDNQVGFYIPQTATDKTDASTGFTAKAFKAYLQVPKEHKTLMFVIPSEDDETEIAPITHITEEVIYDLQGRVINNPTRGIYIQGERKIIIK